MLRLHSRSTRRGGANRIGGLKCERLETRDCPAAPTLLSFNVSRGTGFNIQVSGVVQDDNPTAVHINLSGVASGSFTPNAAGFFNGSTVATGFGQIAAQANDSEGSSSVLTSDYQNLAPQLQLSTAQTGIDQFTISGVVTDEDPSSTTVSLTGVFGGMVQPSATGIFSISFTAGTLGDMHACVTGPGGGSTSPINFSLLNAPPVITNFHAVQAGGTTWILQGIVHDEAPAGLTVLFRSGLAEVDYHTATVMSDGSFSAVVYLKIGESGPVSAQTQDWYGLGSNVPVTYVG
jgi:hypothetical protein